MTTHCVTSKTAEKPKRKKVRVNLHLDEDVVVFFKTIAHDDDDRPYQPLMNKVLRAYMLEVEENQRNESLKQKG